MRMGRTVLASAFSAEIANPDPSTFAPQRVHKWQREPDAGGTQEEPAAGEIGAGAPHFDMTPQIINNQAQCYRGPAPLETYS